MRTQKIVVEEIEVEDLLTDDEMPPPFSLSEITPIKIGKELKAKTIQGDGEIGIHLLKVDPSLAKEWLRRNIKNRRVKKTGVNTLAHAMESGYYKFTGDPIAFDTRGILMNGQHRLFGMVKANKAFDMVVITGLDPSAQVAMDGNIRRTRGDALGLYGYDNATVLASSADFLGKLLTQDYNYPVSNSEAAQLVEKYPKLEEHAVKVGKVPPCFGLGVVAATSLVLEEVLGRADLSKKLVDFLEHGGTPTQDSRDPSKTMIVCDSGSPLKVFREFILSEKKKRGTTHNRYRIGMMIAALNSEITGKPYRMQKAKKAPGQQFLHGLKDAIKDL